MNEKLAKVIRRQCKHYDLPKGMYRKVKKLNQEYNLDIRQTLFLIDKAAAMYYKNMEELTKKMEAVENELAEKESNNGHE